MTTFSDPVFESFVERRDERSFRLLYRAHTPRLFALAVRLCAGDRSDAEDLVQEAWVRAIERLDGFARRSAFRTWISGILVNCHRELLRRRRRGPRSLAEAGVEREAERALADRRPAVTHSAKDLEAALAGLPDGYREVLVLHDLNGYTHREIAELLSVEVGTSKSQLARARQRVRQVLGGETETAPRKESR